MSFNKIGDKTPINIIETETNNEKQTEFYKIGKCNKCGNTSIINLNNICKNCLESK
ncbi:hypothetical protein [Acidithiobacillus sp.]|uniref:hypothetical protein n=1 Tax=Acidithiobacillus sp. TaxID=1872118 RepID=UPI0035640ABD